jgi:hypothetical protein
MSGVLYKNWRCLRFPTMRTVVLGYNKTRRPDVRPFVRLLGGCVVADRADALAVRFGVPAMAGVFCRIVDKLHLPVFVTVIDEPQPAPAKVFGH